MRDKAERFRELHQRPPILVLPNAWDAVSARIFEAEGFPAIATTSAGVAAAIGYADGGMAPAHEMVEAISRIARAVKVPVTADIEHAYGTTPDAVAEVVLRVLAAGAVGINVEDAMPGAADLASTALQADKIKAIVKAAKTAGVAVVVNARTDVFLRQIGPPETRLAAAVERGQAYRAAGADCIFVPGVSDAQTIAALVREIPSPINILAVKGTPAVAELEALGVARVSVGSGPMRAVMSLARDIARELKGAGTYSLFSERAYPYDDLNRLMTR